MPSPHYKLYLILGKAILTHLTTPSKKLLVLALPPHPNPWPSLEERLVCALLLRKA